MLSRPFDRFWRLADNPMDKFETRLQAMLEALRFRNADATRLNRIASVEPGELLRLADRCQLTLPLAVRCRHGLPDVVRARLERNLTGNSLRHERLFQIHLEVISALRSRQVDFCILKGISLWPYYVDELKFRPQYDIDFYCPPEHIGRAQEAVSELGFEPAGSRNTATDHLPAMVRKTGWRWSGDYYDPGIPVSVEIHHRLWSPEVEGIEIGELQGFWDRRCVREIGALAFPAFHPADTLSYYTLHLLRHLFRGDLKLYNVYELAHFLERSSSAHEFWKVWHQNTSRAFRQLQAIAFTFATGWFGCVPHPAVEDARDNLPIRVRRWFELFSLSPALALEHPNKNELLLHLCLIQDRRKQRRIALRRLTPAPMARPSMDAHLRSVKTRFPLRIQLVFSTARFVIGRVGRHARVLPGLFRAALQLRRAQNLAHIPPEPLHRETPLPLLAARGREAFHLAGPLHQEQDRGSERFGGGEAGQQPRAPVLD
jgi:hypothetical protein